MMLLRISSIGALFLVLTHPTEGAKLAGTDLSLETRPILETRSESLEGCGMSSLSKCYGILPPDGSTSSNLIEEIGQVSDAKKCQIFCKDLYHGTCNWFMFDRTTNDCMLFSGSLEDLQGDCREVGYAKEPNHASCDTVFPSNSSDGCYNFREDYCRFDFSLLENLDDIDSLSECQLACEYVSNCSYFLYDNPSKTCKLYTEESIQRTCDIIHGTPEPDINTCIEQGKISWAAQVTVTTGQPTATDRPTEEASSTTVVPASTMAPTTAITITTTATTNTPAYYKNDAGSVCDDESQIIRNITECTKAIEQLGFRHTGTWTGSTASLPAGCSTTQDGDVHFNTHDGIGLGRSDLIPICKRPESSDN